MLQGSSRWIAHWTTQAMAQHVDLLQDNVRRIWPAFELRPHRPQTSKFPAALFLNEKPRDSIGPYLDPPSSITVFRPDKKPQNHVLDRKWRLFTVTMNFPKSRTYDYVGHATAAGLAVLNPATSKVARAVRLGDR